ncbi:MAG: YlqD family protein [Cyanobacteria bacterium]|nr:YlqD family protein [Cyanobacteria bacterium bin.51]
MTDGHPLTIKRTITVRAVVTPRWKEDAERELSAAVSNSDQQLAQLEQEGQQLVSEIRRQSLNPLDPRVQEQVGSVQQQVASKRGELEEQKRTLLEQQRQVRELVFEQIVDQGQIEGTCKIRVGDNLVQKLQVAVLVRDGVIEAIEGGETTAPETTTSESISL